MLVKIIVDLIMLCKLIEETFQSLFTCTNALDRIVTQTNLRI